MQGGWEKMNKMEKKSEKWGKCKKNPVRVLWEEKNGRKKGTQRWEVAE